MGRYIARRLLIAVPTLIVISFVIYAILALAPIRGSRRKSASASGRAWV